MISSKFYRSKINALEMSNDFSDYINLLKLTLPMQKYIFESDASIYEEIFLAYMSLVNRLKIFDNTKQLQEVEQLHTAMFDIRTINWQREIHERQIDLRTKTIIR